VLLVSFVVVVACVQLLTVSGDPNLTTIVFAVGKVGAALFFGGFSLPALLGAGIVCLIAFGYFRLLHRVSGTGWWWPAVVLGVLLLP